ncbi:hypothetical protein PR202_ga22070 [Eleusine coracana subsp. coracana]|uniref:RING-type E3 ubiquitin transferase n=1 Tax=Eleusine coracana subsp. coracana TaxID=191504 RepID=A0AAV5D277_ELECO|nr:hypothetical protein PR202_ga22070 [Eleusine coracana subsp. coracana]
MPDLPCDGDGACMACHAAAPPEVDLIRCSTCDTPWHSPCLSNPPELSAAATWSCPDCSGGAAPAPVPAAGAGGELVAAIRAIEADQTLSDQEKARRRQALLAPPAAASPDDDADAGDHVPEILKNINCVCCMKLPERPVSTPCGHNFCLKCFQKWIHQSSKKTCAKCRTEIPPRMAAQPRINSALVEVIRMAKISKNANSAGSVVLYHYIRNDDRPDKAFTTERAKKTGKANASSGQIFVTIAPDHFGPILVENDPKRKTGVRVGETWEDRLECRQWGAHFPHVAGIAGQSKYGAQSVALSGGYEDDEDHGEWFLYTGSGGRDLSGNKRTNKEQSFDQKFEKLNAALRISCLRGYPVRVVRSHKEKRSSYPPESGVRYDGVYRIDKCWRKVGIQEKEGWKWMVPPPISRKPILTGDPETDKQVRRMAKRACMTVVEMLLKEFGCSICRKVLKEPLTTPCAHNFCKTCLLGTYDSQSSMRERSRGGRTLRAQKIVKKCPSCPNDICDFLENPQINREMMELIESLQRKAVEEGDAKVASEGSNSTEECSDVDSEEDGATEKEEDDISLNEDEQDSAEDKKTECSLPKNKENKEQPRKRKGNAVIGTNPTKKMKSSAGVEVQTRKSGEDADSPAVSRGRRVTRSSANASEGDDSPARRTRSRARADGGL